MSRTLPQLFLSAALLASCGNGSSQRSTPSPFKPLGALTTDESNDACTELRGLGTDDPDYLRSACSIMGLAVAREDETVRCEEFRDECIGTTRDESVCDLTIVMELCPKAPLGEYSDCAAALIARNREQFGDVTCDSSSEVLDRFWEGYANPPPACSGLRASCPAFFELGPR